MFSILLFHFKNLKFILFYPSSSFNCSGVHHEKRVLAYRQAGVSMLRIRKIREKAKRLPTPRLRRVNMANSVKILSIIATFKERCA
jgi:hypothetical protein